MAIAENVDVCAVRVTARFAALSFLTTGLMGIQIRMPEMSGHHSAFLAVLG